MQEIKYIIPAIPPSNNQFIGRDVRWKYQEVKKEWANMVSIFCRPRPQKTFQQATIVFTYYFKDKRRRDPDNYSGKMLLDGLVRTGILQDDSFNNINLILRGRYDKDNPRTEIKIMDKIIYEH